MLKPFTKENGGLLKVDHVAYVEGRGNLIIEYENVSLLYLCGVRITCLGVAFVPHIKNSELNVYTCACVLALDCRNFGSGLHACVTQKVLMYICNCVNLSIMN